MRILLLALIFAAFLASATLVSTDQEALAQEPVYTVVFRKIVDGAIPDSDWNIYYYLAHGSGGIYWYYSTTFTLDKSGGETVIEITDTLLEADRPLVLFFDEKWHSDYSRYFRTYISGFSPEPFTTHNPISQSILLTYPPEQTLIAELRNQYIGVASDIPNKPHPIGGVVIPVNKSAVVAMYLFLIGLTTTVLVVYTIKRKRKP